MMGIKKVLLLWFINFLIKISSTLKGSAFGIKQYEQLAEELHKPIKKFRKRKVYSSFKYNIWSADLADMQLISKFNKGICFYYV